jgi:hypothetical protein
MEANDYFRNKCDNAVELMTTISKELGKVDEIVSDLSFYFKTHYDGYWEASTIFILFKSVGEIEERVQSLKTFICGKKIYSH